MSILDFLKPSPPDVAIEIDATHVAVARIAVRGGAFAAAGHAIEPLPPGVVVPSLSSPNVADVGVVARAIKQGLARLGGRVTRAALVVPDTTAKVSLVRFEKVPASTSDLTELVRWQVRKTAPFPIEQAIVSFTPGVVPPEGGREFVVTVGRADLLAQYENACLQAGVHPGMVDISTFSVINGVLAGAAAPSGDWLLVHATTGYTTLAVLRGGDLMFFRNREEESEASLADVAHQTAMYYEDRLKGAGFTRVLLAGDALESVRHRFEQRLDVPIETLAQPELAPLLGILARERKAA
jgi:Tfp pilus assembly PilM family ATPase